MSSWVPATQRPTDPSFCSLASPLSSGSTILNNVTAFYLSITRKKTTQKTPNTFPELIVTLQKQCLFPQSEIAEKKQNLFNCDF